MDWVSVCGRLLLSCVFLIAAAGKLFDRDGTRRSLDDFGVPGGLIAAGAVALPVTEGLVGVGLLLAPAAGAAAVGAVVLLLGFTAGIVAALRRGEQPDCHCFGQMHSEPAGPGAVIRNLLLIAAAAAVIAVGDHPGIVGFVGDLDAPESAALALGVLSVALAAMAIGLRSRLRTAQEDLRALRERPPAVPVGSPLPEVVVRDPDGASVRITAVVRDTSTALIFLSTTCEPCHDMLPDIARWQRALSETLDIVVLVDGEPVEAAAMTRAHGLQRTFSERGRVVSSAIGAPGTPAAVLVRGEDKSIASGSAFGAPSIEALLRSAVREPELLA